MWHLGLSPRFVGIRPSHLRTAPDRSAHRQSRIRQTTRRARRTVTLRVRPPPPALARTAHSSRTTRAQSGGPNVTCSPSSSYAIGGSSNRPATIRHRGADDGHGVHPSVSTTKTSGGRASSTALQIPARRSVPPPPTSTNCPAVWTCSASSSSGNYSSPTGRCWPTAPRRP